MQIAKQNLAPISFNKNLPADALGDYSRIKRKASKQQKIQTVTDLFILLYPQRNYAIVNPANRFGEPVNDHFIRILGVLDVCI